MTVFPFIHEVDQLFHKPIGTPFISSTVFSPTKSSDEPNKCRIFPVVNHVGPSKPTNSSWFPWSPWFRRSGREKRVEASRLDSFTSSLNPSVVSVHSMRPITRRIGATSIAGCTSVVSMAWHVWPRRKTHWTTINVIIIPIDWEVKHKKGPPRDAFRSGTDGLEQMMDGAVCRTADGPISHYYTPSIKTYFIAANKWQ